MFRKIIEKIFQRNKSYLSLHSLSDMKRILVFGVGGCGSNLVDYAAIQKKNCVSYIVCDTDKQALDSHKGTARLNFDRDSDNESQVVRIAEKYMSQDIKILILASGMGGSTGTTLSTLFAKEARRRGIQTISVVTLPFGYEGEMTLSRAAIGLNALRKESKCILILDNANLEQKYHNSYLHEYFGKVDAIFGSVCDRVWEWTEDNENIENVINWGKVAFKDCGDITVE